MDCDSRVLALLVAWVPTYLVLIQDFCTSVPEGVLPKTTVELVTSGLVAPLLVPIFTCPESMDFRSRFGNIEDDIHLLSAKAFG